MFAVNFGEVGFLATLDPDGLDEEFDRAFAGEFETIELPGITVGRPEGTWTAMNDISVHRKPGFRVADLAYALTGEEIGRVRCDGLVVSTPQGSTGYNLANGGPVLAWGVAGFVVSFIAPHSLTARALVVAPDDLLTINNRSRDEPVEVHVDGRPVVELQPGEDVHVEFARETALLAQLPGASFYHRLRERFGRLARCRRAPDACAASLAPSSCAVVVPTSAHRRRGPGPSAPAGRPSHVLEELRVENLLLIERAELRLGSGLNVLTGETGAGKTVLAHALDLLLGGKPRAGIVRPGASEAYVEGAFELPDAIRAELGDRIADDAEELVLARRVSAEGRTRAYLNGRSATAADLRDVGGVLLSFYGQHEHRKLTLASAQLEILDGFCGPDQAARREAFAAAYAHERGLRDQLAALRERAGARDREIDLLEWELGEIDAAEPSEAEEAELTAERERLRHLEGLRLAAAGGIEALAPESGDGATAALGGAVRVPGGDARRRPGARRAHRPCRRAGGRGRRRGGRAAPLRRVRWTRRRAAWTRSRSGSPCSRSSSASTAARSPRCSRTPRPAAPAATSWPAPRRPPRR